MIASPTQAREDGRATGLDLGPLEQDHQYDPCQPNIEYNNESVHRHAEPPRTMDLTLEDLEPHKTTDSNLFTKFLDSSINQALYGYTGILDERLIQKDHI